MIPKPLDKIDAADIQALVTNGDEERRTMDFKRDLPGNTDKDKNELRADVTSFANAGGGDLIFGVDEAGGVATAVPGLPGVDADAEIRRIEAVIQTSIDPRVPGFASQAIPIPGKGPVIVVRVPKSWRGPHLVKINDTFRMFGRNSKGKYIFDATEIRSAFALSEELPERIRRWRDDRLAKVIGGDTPVPLEDGARLFIHLLPLSSFAGNVELSAGDLSKQRLAFHPPGVSGWNHRVNIDGVMTFSGPRGETKRNNAYCQVFRSGRVEAVSTDIVHVHEKRRIVASLWYEEMMMQSVASYLKGLKELGVPMPIVVLVAISGAKGAWFAVSQRLMGMAHVGSPLRGRVTELKVRLGDAVKRGDPVLIIESPELGEAQSDYLQKRAAAQAAGPAVDLAKSAHERARALYDKSQGIALTEVQKREAEFRTAQAALLTAQTAALGAENKLHLFGMDQKAVETLAASGEVAPHFAITAPIAGRVVEREVTLGELVSPDKEALLVLANTDTLWVLADVPEARLQEIAVGAKVRVTVGTGAGATFAGAVAFISPAVDASTRSAQVRIEVQDGHLSLRPGMFARVEIESHVVENETAAPVLAIPDEAVQTVEGGPAVFVPVPGEENTFAKRPVKVGKAVGGMVPVLSGLKEGERIVVAGSFIMKAELGKGSAGEE